MKYSISGVVSVPGGCESRFLLNTPHRDNSLIHYESQTCNGSDMIIHSSTELQVMKHCKEGNTKLEGAREQNLKIMCTVK